MELYQIYGMDMDVLTLDIKGVLLAFVLAAVMLYVGSFAVGGIYMGLFFVISMVYFLALSAIATWTGMRYKLLIKQYQKARGMKNVLANGLGPLVFVIFVAVAGTSLTMVNALVVGFISSVAAVTADKFSSEIGILDGFPKSIVTGKTLKKGTSGGVTVVGLSAAFVSAFFIALILIVGYLLWFFPLVSTLNTSHAGGVCIGFCSLNVGNNAIISMVLIVSLAGFLGSVVDSFLGYYEEKGIGNKYTSNFVCSVAGGLIGALLYLIFV